ncbi:type II toxin-antitoxin system HicB family antitoxin [Patescibacteria group bacterium]|nr:type II toxin-antitoxin system HicB family antitoxin [Patescibacteria group bacterium]
MYTAAFKKDGKWIAAWIEEVPGVVTQGRTLKEARENLQEALQLMLEINRESAVKTYKGKIRRERFILKGA